MNMTTVHFTEVCLVFLLPRVVSCIWYTVLPLHCQRQNVSLTSLGVVAMASQLLRILIPMVIVRFGSVELWRVKFLTTTLPIVSGCLSLAFDPHGQLETLIFPHLTCLILISMRPPDKALAYRSWESRYGTDKASALHEAFCTVGYSVSSFIGAALYSWGGWHAVVTMQVILCVFIQLMNLHICTWLPPTKSELPAQDVPEVAAREEVAEEVVEATEAATVSFSSAKFHFVCTGQTIVLFVYSAEMSLYALYLMHRFSTPLTVLGITQTAGDLCGAACLFYSCKRTRWHIATWKVMVLFSATVFGFTSHVESIVLFSQTVMGICYVMLVQGIQVQVNSMVHAASGSSSGGGSAVAASSVEKASTTLEAYFVVGMLLTNIASFVLYVRYGGDALFRWYASSVMLYAFIYWAVIVRKEGNACQ